MPAETAAAVSVLTLVRGRADRLRHLMRGLARQTASPRELVIAWMQPEAEPDLPDPGCPVRHLHVPGEPMPLAAARNRAAEAACSDLLVFLDVDCIPGRSLAAAYAGAAARTDGLFLGEVLIFVPSILSVRPKSMAPCGVSADNVHFPATDSDFLSCGFGAGCAERLAANHASARVTTIDLMTMRFMMRSPQSCLRAVNGSMRVARRAGSQHAIAATSSSTTGTLA